MTFKAAIFDMDGTILDTIEDLTAAVNHTMAHFGYRSDFSTEEAKRFFCNGARNAITSALADAGAISGDAKADSKKAEDALIDEVLSYYKPWYAAHSDIRTGPYPGVVDLLKKLGDLGIRTAVVSNKPDPAVQKLCRVYFPDLFTFALGEVEGVPRKPASDMIRICLEKLNVSPDQAVYIGDSEVDVQTAANSSLCSICVDWGFRSRKELTGADRIVSDCDELAEAIIGG
ncbi:MAG: HAD family hydrolase [Firmicutes bacterium]|nr:HAD family hydrolase [Bacillota bacterium]